MDTFTGSGSMKKPPTRKIYVCSPYRATSDDEEERERELRENKERVRKACRILLLCDCMPLAPHAYFPGFLSDENPEERRQGMELGLKWLAEADELWVFGNRISEGMEEEITFAGEHYIPVRYMPEPEELAERWYDKLQRELESKPAQGAEPKQSEDGEADQPAVTKDTLTKVVVAKIKQNRENSDRINQLVDSYGVSQLSDLPANKYEAFLNDLSRL